MNYDAIVVGGGHAGIEAVFALAKQNFKVALISLNKNKLAMMPCNPSIGGPAKGIITREIDALGGMQGYLSDKTMIQIKMLNDSKGPAVKAIRAQIDKDEYSKLVKKEIDKNPNITLIEDVIIDFILDDKRVIGVFSEKQISYFANVVIMTTGTYMDAKILIGDNVKISGPDNEKTTSDLSKNLQKIGHKLIRLKTGTPARVYSDSIDFSQAEEEILKDETITFSFANKNKLKKQIHCWLTYTNLETHQIILDNLEKSSMYSGLINGVGPRYCPSIEDKIVRFKDKNRHQIFLEPETAKGDIFYLNGLSTSMPIEIQEKFIKSIPCLKNARIQKWGYAIEYDAIDSLQIKKTLESKLIDGLFFAGQINGTSGYEEAAGQGLIAGINAAQKLKMKEGIFLLRSDSYIGVLIDDLTIKGTNEPYRMLTSRAEFRLLLRNDNADIRMAKYGLEAGLISEQRFKEVQQKYQEIDNKIIELKNTFLSSNDPLSKKYNITNGKDFFSILARPEVDPNDFIPNFRFQEELIIKIRLEGYIKKQETQANKMIKLESFLLPTSLDYDAIANLATEARIKLKKYQPSTLGQALRISGINPSDIEMILYYINVTSKIKK
ncbi:MAG: tRNA uridine-5-carboxymethylaminomethyl(34) synthesis enzyme MnmG [Metamycoplasmataceae bacterium]